MSDRFQYVEQGTLVRPGPIGRLVRLALALGCVYVMFELIAVGSGLFTSTNPTITAWLLPIAMGLYVFPDVLNIGFGKSWRRSRVTGALLVLAGLAALIGKISFGSFLASPLGGLIYVWLFYTFGHLGIAFLLAVILATPGCEMRSIPQLWGLITSSSQKEHYCPGMLSPLDRWEATRRSAPETK